MNVDESMKTRALIVDDEPLARERIARMLRPETDVEIVAECGNGADAVLLIKELAPDLVFLDIQMPEMNGFEVLQTIAPQHIPAIIFITAYDQYAIRAFDVHALDYLLKPFNRERFRAALNRVREQIKKPEERTEAFAALLSDLNAKKNYLQKFVLKAEGRVYFIKVEDVDWIEAAGNYVKLHVGRNARLLRETMSGVEAKLDPDKFIRVHRSSIVNADRIKELHPMFSGDYSVVLRDGTELTLSRNYRSRLFE